jgi:hypothetical protein
LHVAKALCFVFIFSFLKAKPKVWRFSFIAPDFQITANPCINYRCCCV